MRRPTRLSGGWFEALSATSASRWDRFSARFSMLMSRLISGNRFRKTGEGLQGKTGQDRIRRRHPDLATRQKIAAGNLALELDDILRHASGQRHHLLAGTRQRITGAATLEQLRAKIILKRVEAAKDRGMIEPECIGSTAQAWASAIAFTRRNSSQEIWRGIAYSHWREEGAKGLVSGDKLCVVNMSIRQNPYTALPLSPGSGAAQPIVQRFAKAVRGDRSNGNAIRSAGVKARRQA